MTANSFSYSSFPLLHAFPCGWLVFHVVCFFLGLKVFGEQNENPCREPFKKIPVFQLCCSQLALYLIQSRTYWFKSRLSWKWRVERFLRKGKMIVHSGDQANNSLDLEQSCSSGQVLCRFIIELLQQHRVILHVVWILWSGEIQSPSRSLLNQSFNHAQTFGPPPVRKLSRPNSNTRSELDFFSTIVKKTFRFYFEVKSKIVY